MKSQHQRNNNGIFLALMFLFGIALAVLTLAWLFEVRKAAAHEWYPPACCEESHCHPVACNEIHNEASDMVWHGYRIARQAVKEAPDGRCHVCLIPLPPDGKTTVMKCMFLSSSS